MEKNVKYKECELAINRRVCVYTASLSQVLYDPWDYSRGDPTGLHTHTHTHTQTEHHQLPTPQKKKRGGETGGREV